MIPARGYIPIRGTIDSFPFQQTLVPIKNSKYRLYVNGPMLKGSNLTLGKMASFIIEQDFEPKFPPFPAAFRKELVKHDLLEEFEALVPSRRKEVLRYLGFLKSEEALTRNIAKVIDNLKRKAKP